MIFEALYDSAKAGELLLIDGGFCRWHIRRDGVLMIREIIATRQGAGSKMLEMLKGKGYPIKAKCPTDLPANDWYGKKGFRVVGQETTKTGRRINVWQLN